MKDDIQNYLSTVMFRGTPCIYKNGRNNKKLKFADFHSSSIFVENIAKIKFVCYI